VKQSGPAAAVACAKAARRTEDARVECWEASAGAQVNPGGRLLCVGPRSFDGIVSLRRTRSRDTEGRRLCARGRRGRRQETPRDNEGYARTQEVARCEARLPGTSGRHAG